MCECASVCASVCVRVRARARVCVVCCVMCAHLCSGLLDALLDRNGHTFHHFEQLELLLTAHVDVLELVRLRKHANELDFRQLGLEQSVVP